MEPNTEKARELQREYVRRGNDFVAAMETVGFHYTTSKGYKYWHGIKIDMQETYRNRYAATV